MDGDVTIRETADLLNATVAFVRALIEKGTIRARLIDGHTLLRSGDVIAFKRRDDEYRLKIANDLSAEARHLGLDY